MGVRIVLVDDHKIVRDGLRTLLGRELDFQVVGEAEDGRTAVQTVAELRPDVVLMDIAIGGISGIEATARILRIVPETRVIALSMHAEDRFVAEMLKAGAVGYLHKDCAYGELANAVRTVMAGRMYMSEGVEQTVLQDYRRRLAVKPDEASTVSSSVLTPREIEVLQLISEGASTKSIAAQLHLSAKTVETHRRRIMDKLDITTLAGLTKYAIRHGLTSVE